MNCHGCQICPWNTVIQLCGNSSMFCVFWKCPRQLPKDSGHPLEFPREGLANCCEIEKLIILTLLLWVRVRNMPWFFWILCLAYLKLSIAKKTRPPSLEDYAVLCLVTQSCPTLCDPMDCGLPGSSVHGILQARILEWDVMSSSRWSSQPRDWTQLSHITGRFFTILATRETDFHVQIHTMNSKKLGVGLDALYVRWDPAEILNALKVWKFWETASAPTFIMDQYAMHWEHQAPLSQGAALSPSVCNETSHRDAWDTFHFGVRANYCLPWDPIFLLQTFWNALYLEWNIEREEKEGFLVWHILPSVHLVTSNSAASRGQHIWYAQPGQVP